MIKPASNQNLCLTASDTNSSIVKITQCENKINQKWRTPDLNETDIIKPLDMREAISEDFGELYMTKDSKKATKFKFIESYFAPELGVNYKLKSYAYTDDQYKNIGSSRLWSSAFSESFTITIKDSKIYIGENAVNIVPTLKKNLVAIEYEDGKCLRADNTQNLTRGSCNGDDVSIYWEFVEIKE